MILYGKPKVCYAEDFFSFDDDPKILTAEC